MNNTEPVALVTGGSKRIGREICKALHARNFRIIIHYRESAGSAETLADELNAIRENSAITLQADLGSVSETKTMGEKAVDHWQRVDLLVNNASGFYSTPVGEGTENDWEILIGSNVKGAFFLSETLYPALKKNHGSIINITDIYSEKPLPGHSIYCIAKAGLGMMTRSLALEYAPEVRVNAIAPGTILWPEDNDTSFPDREGLVAQIPLKTIGSPENIVDTLCFLALDAPYITGQVIAVDGGLKLR